MLERDGLTFQKQSNLIRIIVIVLLKKSAVERRAQNNEAFTLESIHYVVRSVGRVSRESTGGFSRSRLHADAEVAVD